MGWKPGKSTNSKTLHTLAFLPQPTYSEFYDELQELAIAIDWDIMGEVYWADTDQDGDRKRRRQAEFLIHRFCPWSLITEIGVINATVQKRVCQILQNMKVSTPVTVYNGWYY